MKVASAMVTSYQPLPAMAEAAVRKAMQKAELKQAACVFLFMTRDMAYCAKAAVTAAARVAGCLQVHGCTAYGIFTENGWVLEQSGAAALVMDCHFQPADSSALALSLTGSSTLPAEWQSGRQRFGLLESNSTIWSNGRVSPHARAEIALGHLQQHQSIVNGLRSLTETLIVDEAEGYEVKVIGGKPAIESLRRELHPELRDDPPLHRMAALRRTGESGIPILSHNADGSITLGEPFKKGDTIIWTMRQALFAERFMREAMDVAVDALPDPDFALMFSCIGRGPLFFGDEDLDLDEVCKRFPGLPLIGAYGSGQIATLKDDNLLYQNTAITLLLKEAHV